MLERLLRPHWNIPHGDKCLSNGIRLHYHTTITGPSRTRPFIPSLFIQFSPFSHSSQIFNLLFHVGNLHTNGAPQRFSAPNVFPQSLRSSTLSNVHQSSNIYQGCKDLQHPDKLYLCSFTPLLQHLSNPVHTLGLLGASIK